MKTRSAPSTSNHQPSTANAYSDEEDAEAFDDSYKPEEDEEAHDIYDGNTKEMAQEVEALKPNDAVFSDAGEEEQEKKEKAQEAEDDKLEKEHYEVEGEEDTTIKVVLKKRGNDGSKSEELKSINALKQTSATRVNFEDEPSRLELCIRRRVS